MDCPHDYADFILKFGGKDPDFDRPLFMLYWGSRANPNLIVPNEFLAPYLDCWTLAEFLRPSELGLPEDWPGELFGPYPLRGGYVPLFLFKDGGKPCRFDDRLLNKPFLHDLMKVHLQHKHDSLKERIRVKRELDDKKQDAQIQRIADVLQDAYPRFGDSASFHGQANCNTYLKQKMDMIEKNIGSIRDFRKRFVRGPQIAPTNRIAVPTFKPV